MKKTAAYHEWLGIPPDQHPPNHYALLGIPVFESNRTVISNAASRQINFLQTLFGGNFSELSQAIQKEVAAAKMCLIDEQRRGDYDNQLAVNVGNIVGMDNSQGASDSGSASASASASAGTYSSSNNSTSEFPSVDIFIEEMRYKSMEVAQKEMWLIGSSDECDLALENDFVSRKHCLLIRVGDEFEVEDLESTNGTYVNKVKLVPHQRVEVTRSDIVTLGRRTLMPWPPIQNIE